MVLFLQLVATLMFIFSSLALLGSVVAMTDPGVSVLAAALGFYPSLSVWIASLFLMGIAAMLGQLKKLVKLVKEQDYN